MSTTAESPSPWRLAAALLGVATTLAACSSNPPQEPEALPSQTAATVKPQIEPPPTLPPPVTARPPIREVEPTRSAGAVTVIDPGGDPGRPTSLVEASRLAKSQKGETQEPIATINDDNLHEYAEGGDVIVLESEPAAPGPQSEPAAVTNPAPEGTGQGEDYWRTRALELRMGWRRTVDRVQELELEAAALRQQFYAEEDPYIRDSQLKPAWDRVLDRLDQLRDRSARYDQDLDIFIDEGRRAGALQGWLNQGWELEPSPEERERTEKKRVEPHEAVDVPTVDEGGRP